MTYIRSNKKARSQKMFLRLVGVGFVVLVLFMLRWFAPAFSNATVAFIAQPFVTVGSLTGDTVSSWGVYFASKQSLERENEALKNEIDQYRINMLTIDALRKENERLSRDLDLQVPANIESVPARILVKPPESPYDIITVDAGRTSGVVVGDGVYALGNVYLGIVTATGLSTATVELASNPDKETQAVVFPSDTYITITGQGASSFEAQLPADVEVAVGDRVLTRGRSASVIGIVRDISVRASDSFQIVRIVSPVNVSELGWVSIYRTATAREQVNEE